MKNNLPFGDYRIHFALLKRLNFEDENDSTIVRLKHLMHGQPLPTGLELINNLGDWADYLSTSGSGGTSDWHIQFLRWAVFGRAQNIVNYARQLNTISANKTLAGFQQVYDYSWPHQFPSGYLFAYLWGWLQLELEKPGERGPPTIAEQKERIEKALAADGKRVKEWSYLPGGGVQAVAEPFNATDFDRSANARSDQRD